MCFYILQNYYFNKNCIFFFKICYCTSFHHKVKVSLCLPTYHVVSFTPQLLYPQGKSPQYPLDRRLDGAHIESGHSGEEENSLPCQKSNPGHPAHSLVSILIELSQFLYIICMCIIPVGGWITCSVTKINHAYLTICLPNFS